MVISLSNNKLNRFRTWASNTYERFTHWYWNRKPYHVTCRICGDVLKSTESQYSPEECGWECSKDGFVWICHQCLDHRNFKPYLRLVDIDERIVWYPEDAQLYKYLRRLMLRKMSENDKKDLEK